MVKSIAALCAVLVLNACSSGMNSDASRSPAPKPARQVAYQLRSLRVAEENAAIAAVGHTQPLPIGRCSAVISLTADGMVSGSPLIECENPALSVDFQKAIFAAAPFTPRPGYSQLHITVDASDLEPGVGEPTGT